MEDPLPQTALQDSSNALLESHPYQETNGVTNTPPSTTTNTTTTTAVAVDGSFPNVPTTPSRGRAPEMVGPFVLGLTLGRGQTGKVRLGVHKDTGFKVAIKIVSKRLFKEDRRQRQRVEREVAILKLIDHPNVMKLHDVWETRRHLFIVMEHVDGGELFDYILSKGRLPRHEALRFFAQIVQGLEHCHSFSICHRDLKPENILLDSNQNIKIADFGMATVMKYGASLNTSCGSPHYTSPEVVSGGKYDGKLSDVWSAGVVLYALVTAQLPFDHETTVGLLKIVRRGVFKIPEHVDPDIADLIRRMLTVQPEKRIRMSEIKFHPCFRSPFSVLVKPSIRSNSYASLSKARRRASDLQTTADDFEPYFPPEAPCDCIECLSGKRSTCARRHGLDVRTARPLKSESDIDRGVLDDLYHLGWGTREELVAILTSERPNLEQIFYYLLLQRKQGRLAQLKRLRMTGTHVFSATPKPTSSGAFSFPTPHYPPGVELPVPVPGLNRALSMDDEPCTTKQLPPAIPEYGEAEPSLALSPRLRLAREGEPSSQLPSPPRRSSTASNTSEGVIRSPSRGDLPPPGPSSGITTNPVSAAELLGADRPRFRRPQVELQSSPGQSAPIFYEEVTAASGHGSPSTSMAALELSSTGSSPEVQPVMEAKRMLSPPHSCPPSSVSALDAASKAIPTLALSRAAAAPPSGPGAAFSSFAASKPNGVDAANLLTSPDMKGSLSGSSPVTVSPLEQDAAINALASSPRRHFQKIRASILERRRSPPASVPTRSIDGYITEDGQTHSRHNIPKLNFPPAALPLGVPLSEDSGQESPTDTRINIESLSQPSSARNADQVHRPQSFLSFGVDSYVTARRHSAVDARPDLWVHRKAPVAAEIQSLTAPMPPSNNPEVVISIKDSASTSGDLDRHRRSPSSTNDSGLPSFAPSPSSSPSTVAAPSPPPAVSATRSKPFSALRLALAADVSPPLHFSTPATSNYQVAQGALVTPRFHRVRAAPVPPMASPDSRRSSITSPPTTPSTKKSWFSSLFNLAPDYGRPDQHRRASSTVTSASFQLPPPVPFPAHTSNSSMDVSPPPAHHRTSGSTSSTSSAANLNALSTPSATSPESAPSPSPPASTGSTPLTSSSSDKNPPPFTLP